MKKQLIRHSVFETNSSSSHSISVADEAKEFVLETIYPDQDGKIILTGGQFGWEWDKFNDALTKANYCAVDCENDEISMETLKEVIMEQTGATEVVYVGTGDYDGAHWSYIDHDSAGVARSAFSSKETLRNFIFNKNSWLFTGNDNSTADPTFYDVPEFKEGKQILPRYKFELKIEGYKKTTKFKEEPNEEDLTDAFHSLLQGIYLYENGYFDDDNSIAAQIGRNRSQAFEYTSYKKRPDLEKKEIYFIRDAYYDANRQWERENPTADWDKDKGYEAVRKIEEELYARENSPYIKVVKYEVVPVS